MGSASSKDRQDDTVDYGSLTAQGVYTATQDWNQQIVAQLIIDRKLAPFYRPLEDYDDSWDDERILAARKELAPPPTVDQPSLQGGLQQPQQEQPSVHQSSHRPHTGKSAKAAGKEPQRLTEARLYRGAVECPICFLYYPQNINVTRCCDQAICTECFAQIKRSEPTPTHLVSEPACCPYCVQSDFGVVYSSPSWRAGIGGDSSGGSRGDGRPRAPTPPGSTAGTGKHRRKTPTPEEVVTIDQIRPDWEAKLNAVKAAVTRRANRRIIMRQVGDRLIPVGVTSGRIQILEEGAEGASEESARRSRRRGPPPNSDLGQLLHSIGVPMAGQDLEDILLQEAMRLSLLEHDAEQKKREDEERKKTAAGGRDAAAAEGSSAPFTASSPSTSIGREPARSGGHTSMPSSSSLANTSGVIAVGIGSPALLQPGRAPSSNSNSRSRSHSRNSSRIRPVLDDSAQIPSSSAPPFGTLAGAMHAASVAGAFVSAPGVRPPERSDPKERVHDLVETATFDPGHGAAHGRETNSLPDLPVIVSASDLFEDVNKHTTSPPGGGTPSDPTSTSGSSPSPLPTRVQGVTATSADIPTPPRGSAVVTPTPVPPSRSPGSTLSPDAFDSGGLSDADTSTSTEDGDDPHNVGDMGMNMPGHYHTLASTPNLTSMEPLIDAGDYFDEQSHTRSRAVSEAEGELGVPKPVT